LEPWRIIIGPWRLSLEPWRIILVPWKLGLETWRIILEFSMLNLEPWRIITGPLRFFLKPWRKFWGLGGSTLAYAKTRIVSNFIEPKPEKTSGSGFGRYFNFNSFRETRAHSQRHYSIWG
jgi:hypothetical protein